MWTAPKTWTNEELVDEDDLQTHLRDNMRWLGGVTGIGTSLPVSPIEGEAFILTDSLTVPTYTWHLRYFGSRASNKWLYFGGGAIFSEVVTDESTSSTSYTALATGGPSITIPVAGDYLVSHGFESQSNNNSSTPSRMSYDIGATGAADADAVIYTNNDPGAAQVGGSFSRTHLKTGLTAVTLTAKYKVGAGTISFANRWMQVLPVALGG